jgi:FkbM family methyltransferase
VVDAAVTGGTKIPLSRLMVGAQANIKGWWWLLPLSALVAPSRLPPRHGIPALARREITVRLTTGDTVRCQVVEAYGLIEVFAERVYGAPELKVGAASRVLDVGANIGFASIWFARQSPAARVVAVEPASDTCDRLRANIRRNGLDDRVEIVRAAVGGEDGVAHIGLAEQGRLRATSDEPGPRSETVDRVTLGRLLALAGGPVDVLKIDCEGAEYDFLLGAPLDALAGVRAIVGEYHPASSPLQTRLFEHLEGAGFTCRVEPDGGIDGLAQGTFTAWRAEALSGTR